MLRKGSVRRRIVSDSGRDRVPIREPVRVSGFLIRFPRSRACRRACRQQQHRRATAQRYIYDHHIKCRLDPVHLRGRHNPRCALYRAPLRRTSIHKLVGNDSRGPLGHGSE